MLGVAFIFSNFLHCITSLQTALVTQRSLRWGYITVLCYMYNIPTLISLEQFGTYTKYAIFYI